MSFFEPEQSKNAPRHSWGYYGISKERRKELKDMLRSGRYTSIASQVAYTIAPDIAEYILLSVTKKLSYEGLQELWELYEIERMPCGRTDFYGWRRCFISLFDKEIKEIENDKRTSNKEIKGKEFTL